MNAVGRYFSQRLGVRGQLLLLMGSAYGLYGVGQFLSAPATRFGNLGPFFTGLINTHAIGWLWIVGGLLGVVQALRPRRENDAVGFISVFIPLMVWSVFYHISWIVGALTDNTFGNRGSWVTSIVWTVQAGIVLRVAGVVDPDPEARPDGVTRE